MEEGDLRINGTIYDPNTMTFREQREMRRIIREELFGGDPVDEESLALADMLPAMAVVLVRRDDPTYTLDKALDLIASDVVVTAEQAKQNGGAKRPTKPAASRTRAASGPAE